MAIKTKTKGTVGQDARRHQAERFSAAAASAERARANRARREYKPEQFALGHLGVRRQLRADRAAEQIETTITLTIRVRGPRKTVEAIRDSAKAILEAESALRGIS